MTNYERDYQSAESPAPMEGVYVIDAPDLEGEPEEVEKRLLDKINKGIKTCQPYRDELWRTSEKSRDYYVGKQIKDGDLYEGETKIVDNRIFTSIETLVPLIVKNLSEPILTLTPINKRTSQLGEKLRNYIYNDLFLGAWDMKTMHSQAVRAHFTDRYACYKIFYDTERECIDVELVPRGRMYVLKEARNECVAPYLIELIDSTYGEVCEKFPDKEQAVYELINKGQKVDENSPIRYYEYWENEFVAWKFKNVLLGYDKNPNYNWENKKMNQFVGPKMPYIFLRENNFGDSIIDPISKVEQVVGLQDGINKRKRQIEQNADFGNGMLIGSGDFMTKESLDKIDFTAKSKLFIQKGVPSQALTFFTGRAFDQGIMTDLTASQNEIDNILGTHPATRGLAGTNQRTLGATMMLKSADSGRLETIERSIATVDQALYEWSLQLMYVFYTKKHPIMSIGKTGDIKTMSELQRKNFIVNSELKDVKIVVKTEINVGKDDSERKVEALNLFKLGCLSTKDLLKILGYPNPETLAQNAAMQQLKPDMVYPMLNNDEPFDVEAIEHTELLQAGTDISAPRYLTQTRDISMLNSHIATHTDYIKGVEIEENLEPYEQMLSENQKKYNVHVKQENDLLRALLAQQQQMQPMGQGGNMAPPVNQPQSVGPTVQQTPNTGMQQNPMPRPPGVPNLGAGMQTSNMPLR